MGRRGGGRSDRGVQTGRSVASLSFRQFRNLSAFGRQNGDAQAWRAFSVPLQGKRGNKIRRGTPALHPGGCRALFQRRHIYFQFRIQYVRPFLRLSVLRLPAKPMEENPARDASGTRTAVKTAREKLGQGGFPQGELQKDVSPASPSCRKRFSPEECPAGAGRPPQALPGITGAYVPPPRRRRDHLPTLRLPHRPRAPASRTQDPPLRPPSARSRCRCAQGRTMSRFSHLSSFPKLAPKQ